MPEITRLHLFLSFSFSIKWLFHKKKIGFLNFFFFIFLSSSCAAYGLCHLKDKLVFVTCCNIFLCVGDLKGKVDSIKERHKLNHNR